MAKIKIMAGDFEEGAWTFTNSLSMFKSTKAHPIAGESVFFKNNIEKLELMNEEKVKKLAGTAGWGLAGAALLGPVGAIGGILLGGNKKQVVFACYLKDGKKFMAETDSKVWTKLNAAIF